MNSCDISPCSATVLWTGNSYISARLPSPNLIIDNNYDKKLRGYTYKINDIIIPHHPPPTKDGKTINLCVYNINHQFNRPFLSFLLYKYPPDFEITPDLLVLPHFVSNGDNIFELANKELEKVFKEWDHSAEYKGYIERDGEYYLFYEKIMTEVYLFNQSRSESWWWCIGAEIINLKQVLNFPVHKKVTELFIKNPLLLVLFNTKEEKIEVPEIAFHGSYYKTVTFISIFGLARSSPVASMGPYYYFGTYKRAGRYALWTVARSGVRHPIEVEGELITADDNGRFTKGGLVRFALFMGKTKVFLNRASDLNDPSTITQNELEVRNQYVLDTAKLRDVNARWIADNDSTFVGTFLLGENKRVMQPQMTVKNYNQQIPLSYHYVDTEQAKDKNRENFDNYYIN